MSGAPLRRAALATLLLSAGILAYEILLVRIFAIRYFHHFAAMAIAVAMLGFGASGTYLALKPPRSGEAASRLFLWAALATPLLLVACPVLANRVPLDPTQLPSDPREWPRLFLTYLLLSIPFFTGALAILLAVARAGERSGLLYGASFLGSGLGVGLALGAAFLSPPAGLTISAYKGLPQVEAYPDASRVADRASPLGWVVGVEAPAFRYAPGLSLTFEGSFPRQTALFVDGQLAGALSWWPGVDAARPLVTRLPAAIPYALPGRDRVLVLGAGGGTEVWIALAGGAREVTAAELHPELARLGDASLRGAGGAATRVEWAVGDARSIVARSADRYDLITLGAAGAFGTTVAGVHALEEDFLHTVEAYAAYLKRLGDRGLLAVTRWVGVPPRAEARAILTAAEALRRVAPGAAQSGLVVARSWATVTVLAKPSGFSSEEIAALGSWARAQQVDLDWHPGIGAPRDTFNVLEGGSLFSAAQAAAAGRREAARFASAYPFDIAPSTDARPYPHHFLRARSLGPLFAAGSGTWHPFAEWGYVALLATLAQASLLGFLLLGITALAAPAPLRRGGLARLVLYFGAIGFAYLAAEIAAIQQLALLLGHPVYAVAAALAAMLVFSGLGSAWSDRIRPDRLSAGLAAVAILLGLLAAFLLQAARWVQPAPLAVRAGVAVLALAPPAWLMGWAFPIGLRTLAGSDDARKGWAWAVNGFASVVAAPLSAIIALESGSRTLFALAAASYLFASFLLAPPRRRRGADARGGRMERHPAHAPR